MLHMGFEPTTYRLKTGYSTIELMELIMRAITDSHYSFFHADIEICSPVITKISSILTPNTDANTTKLSIVGNAVPCCHL